MVRFYKYEYGTLDEIPQKYGETDITLANIGRCP